MNEFIFVKIFLFHVVSYIKEEYNEEKNINVFQQFRKYDMSNLIFGIFHIILSSPRIALHCFKVIFKTVRQRKVCCFI